MCVPTPCMSARGGGMCVLWSRCAQMCVCGEGEENESTGSSFIHSPLKQYYRSITNQIRNDESEGLWFCLKTAQTV